MLFLDFKRGRGLVALAWLACAAMAARAQNADSLWQPLAKTPAALAGATPWVQPPVYAGFVLNPAAMRAALAAAPKENFAAPARFAGAMQITIPMPDGTLARFQVIESSVMAPELAAQFPELKTYLGVGVDDPAAAVRLDLTPAGFHAQILSPNGAVYVDPLWQGETTQHASYYKRNYLKDPDGWMCFQTNSATSSLTSSPTKAARTPADLARLGDTLRTYRLAVAATGEYTAFHGGTVSNGMSAIVTAVNRVTGVYEIELAIRLVLVANNSQLVYTNSATDPYSNNNSSSLLTQNQANLDSLIGSANYDIGHVFSTAGGGLAGLGVVCVAGSKAQGETGTSSPIGDAYYIDYVAHEMGHQFGADHTFNSTTGSCGGGNRNGPTAYEVGSGTTIMAYAGICGTDNVQLHSDPYFHAGSLDEILTYITADTGSNCPVLTSTTNTAPNVTAGPNFTIPASTPFILTAIGSDSFGDLLTYCWEEMDLGAAQTLTAADNGTSPLFRSYNPTTNAWRTFPTLSAILNNTNATGEKLPTVARTANFRVTARDNRAGGGGVSTANMQVIVDATSGPFVITSPNSNVTWSGTRTVTWNVANTTNAAVNCQSVNLRLSTNSGLTFSYLLASAVPNNGSATITLPPVNTTTARLKVEPATGIFFDISDADFTITNTTPTAFLTLNSATLAAENCTPANGAMDPGELVAVRFVLQNVGTTNASNLVLSLRATNGVTAPDGPVTNGLLAPGALVTNLFTFVASGACGGSLACVLGGVDGSNSFGPFTSPFTLGAQIVTSASFTNTNGVAIPASGTSGISSPYPSTLVASNVPTNFGRVTVQLRNLSHTFPGDLDILLVGPGGQKVMLMSDAGSGTDLVNATLTFSDAGAALPDTTALTSGTYHPADFGSTPETMTSPAPGRPYATNLSDFKAGNPNGTWSLYIVDDGSQDTGTLGSWSLTFTSTNFTCCTTPSSDLAVALTAPSPVVVVGSNFAFNHSLTNLGPDPAAVLTVTNELPAGAGFVTATVSQGSWTNAGSEVVVTFTNLAAGGSATASLTMLATNSGSFTNSARAGSSAIDPNPTNNFATAVVTVPVDFDGDGLPDVWEIAHGLSPTNATDALKDFDGDGLTNLQEYLAGTDPNDPRNFLNIIAVLVVPPDAQITFNSISGRFYRLESRDDLATNAWLTVTNNIPGTGAPVILPDPGAAAQSQRTYRVRLLP